MEETIELAELFTWNLFVDGLAGEVGSGAGVVLVNPKSHKLNSTVWF